jgi:tRNA A-37 threonylcarbamoyl transferase component Bud32
MSSTSDDVRRPALTSAAPPVAGFLSDDGNEPAFGMSWFDAPEPSRALEAASSTPADQPPQLSPADLPALGSAFLEGLFRCHLLTPSAVTPFLREQGDKLAQYTDAETLSSDLVRAGILTEYQARRILAGASHGLVLGSYRVLEELGFGGMGAVYVAEHVFMKRRVAVKVLQADEDCSSEAVNRFYSEMRVLAELHHPNIVMAYDAGKVPSPAIGVPDLLYLVMELVPGGDLQRHVLERGRVAIAQACEWTRQAACGLQAAHDQHLIHRDVKPSNLLLTPTAQIKIVDFGLVRQFRSRLTEPRALLGTLHFMSPEQSLNPSAVGSQADIYGLGATLFWLLTHETPYPEAKTMTESLRRLRETRPRRLADFRPEVPRELQDLVDRMLDPDPTRRPALPLTVMKALEPFCQG